MIRLIIYALLAMLSFSPAVWAADMDYLMKLYRHFHQNPELSFQEEQTAARISDELKELGFEVTTGVGGHGLVGVLENGAGPTILIRTDLDGLPVVEA
ncbi:MAG: amidohydrolase, partial [Proteobacteria bacterium]|nr:amidohydrolase [Pseudomonadota bacterium]